MGRNAARKSAEQVLEERESRARRHKIEEILSHQGEIELEGGAEQLVQLRSEVDLESLSLGTNPDFLALIEQSRARCRAGEGISTDEMRARISARRRQAG